MDYSDAIDRLDPALVEGLRRAVETGRWPDGRALTPQQRRDSLQAVIAWEARHLPQAQRVGFIERRKGGGERQGPAPLRWADEPPGAAE